MVNNHQESLAKGEGLALGNNLTLDELSQIEAMARRSRSHEAETILRLSAALREAMQIRENAIALMNVLRSNRGAGRDRSDIAGERG